MAPSTRIVRNALAIATILVFTVTMRGQTSETTSIASTCKEANNMYTCDSAKFQQALGQAKTAAIETGPVDPAAQNQLKKLFVALGFVAPADGEPADLTFLLVPVDPRGVSYGQGETQTGTLHVFARRSGPGRGDLVWADNFIGPEDLPWPIVVNRLISQFRNRFHIKDPPKSK